MKRAVVVFSGGQDSTTCLVQALQQYDEVHCVTFDYGQRHRAEIDVARELALKLGAVAHKVLDVTLLNELAVSSLTRDNIPVPDYQPDAEGIPNTFVPGRNMRISRRRWMPFRPYRTNAAVAKRCATSLTA